MKGMYVLRVGVEKQQMFNEVRQYLFVGNNAKSNTISERVWIPFSYWK